MAVREVSVDVEAAVERATRTASAAQWEQFGGEPTGVKKKGKKKKLTARGGRLARMKRDKRRAGTARQGDEDDTSDS